MGDWPATELYGARSQFSITSFHPDSGAHSGRLSANFPTGVAWPATNQALFVPFRLSVPATAYRMVAGGGTTAGSSNCDLGIYDRGGNRLVSSGATARVVGGEVDADITDTPLLPGVYYMAMATNNTHTWVGVTMPNVGICKMGGLRQMATAYTLPATATYSTITTTLWPAIAVLLRSW